MVVCNDAGGLQSADGEPDSRLQLSTEFEHARKAESSSEKQQRKGSSHVTGRLPASRANGNDFRTNGVFSRDRAALLARSHEVSIAETIHFLFRGDHSGNACVNRMASWRGVNWLVGV